MPKIVDHAEKRRELADAVLRLIARQGLSEITNRTVASEAGCSTGSLTYYFPSREELLLGTLRRAAEIEGDFFRQIHEQHGEDPRRALQLLVERGLPFPPQGVASISIFLDFYAKSTNDAGIREEVASYLANWRRTIARAIRRCQERDAMDPALPVDEIAAEIVALVDGYAIHHLIAGSSGVSDPAEGARLAKGWIERLTAPASPVGP
ncbi:TetR/AcrR family transcriptional regulator [Leucobacter sp. CSA1]|uniref:TetR/AcrR family transcriptional regulator n=1 Tax=Leucobacter chromiisoli TaxID=2796471 RepID=A0A934Q6U5_9MICO|nr:TetR/AcrR family transcriptional regulator [Leucobacter chromiisoli]MBK0418796.1 TetR/AcrR family transcriptional regulator [Leucobacter chromiisoli]